MAESATDASKPAAAANAVDDKAKEEILQKFAKMTGVCDDKKNRTILDKNNWDLESAIREQLEITKTAPLRAIPGLSLTPEQMDILREFQRLTGIWDPMCGAKILENFKWDLQAAVEKQFRRGYPCAYPDEPSTYDIVVNHCKNAFNAIVFYTYNAGCAVVGKLAIIKDVFDYLITIVCPGPSPPPAAAPKAAPAPKK